MKRTIIALAIAGTLRLVGCGSEEFSPTSSDLATRIGCTDYVATFPPTLYAREEGGCTLGDDDLDIVTFSDHTAEDNWLKAASAFGGIIVKGDQWAIGTGSQASADAVMAKIGGSIKS